MTGSQMHAGHRERLKNRYLQEGLDSFDEVNVLELLLCFCIPKQDTNPIAHRLLEEFGSIKNVFDANCEDLQRVKGMGKHSSLFISLMKDVSRYYAVKCAQAKKVLSTLNDCGNYLKEFFVGRNCENVFLLSLDARSAVINCRKVSEGDLNSANISIRKVIEIALQDNATSMILAHNHPGGVAMPSSEDLMATIRVAKALSMVDVNLIDHIIISGEDFISLVQSGMYSPDMAAQMR